MNYCCVSKYSENIDKNTNSNITKKFRTVTKEDTKYIDYICPICLNNYKFGSTVTILKCGHIFHRDCINQWHEKKEICPICQT